MGDRLTARDLIVSRLLVEASTARTLALTVGQLLRDDPVAEGILDRARDAAAIDRLAGLAALIDETRDERMVTCPHCEADVVVGADTVAVVRVSKELRAWWQAIRQRREAVSQGVTLDSIFADLDESLRSDQV